MSNSNSQPTKFALTCTTCGAKLGISHDTNIFACASCGSEFVVKRGDGVIALVPAKDGLSELLVQNQRGAGEVTLARIERELAVGEAEIEKLQGQFEEEQVALAHQMPGRRYFVLTGVLGIVGTACLFSKSTPVLSLGFGMMVIAVWLFTYGLRRRNTLADERAELLAEQQRKLAVVQARVTDKQEQREILRRNLN